MRNLREALAEETPLHIVGVMNAYVAMMAKQAGFKAIYLSGANVANTFCGLPDIGITTLHDVLDNVSRITAVVDLPLLVDIDTGWGGPAMIARSIKALSKAGAAAIHIEDQIGDKICGHLPGKQLVSKQEMVARIQAAVDAKNEKSFIVVARTDAYTAEGLEKTIERSIAYREAGADMIFPDAMQHLSDYERLKQEVQIPIIANLTEFGKTPLFALHDLQKAKIDIALYPLTINRVMNFSALNALRTLRSQGTQKELLAQMQTRQELYEILGYIPKG